MSLVEISYPEIVSRWEKLIDILNVITTTFIKQAYNNVPQNTITILDELVEQMFTRKYEDILCLEEKALEAQPFTLEESQLLRQLSAAFVERFVRFLLKMCSLETAHQSKFIEYLITILRYFRTVNTPLFTYISTQLLRTLQELLRLDVSGDLSTLQINSNSLSKLDPNRIMPLHCEILLTNQRTAVREVLFMALCEVFRSIDMPCCSARNVLDDIMPFIHGSSARCRLAFLSLVSEQAGVNLFYIHFFDHYFHLVLSLLCDPIFYGHLEEPDLVPQMKICFKQIKMALKQLQVGQTDLNLVTYFLENVSSALSTEYLPQLLACTHSASQVLNELLPTLLFDMVLFFQKNSSCKFFGSTIHGFLQQLITLYLSHLHIHSSWTFLLVRLLTLQVHLLEQESLKELNTNSCTPFTQYFYKKLLPDQRIQSSLYYTCIVTSLHRQPELDNARQVQTWLQSLNLALAVCVQLKYEHPKHLLPLNKILNLTDLMRNLRRIMCSQAAISACGLQYSHFIYQSIANYMHFMSLELPDKDLITLLLTGWPKLDALSKYQEIKVNESNLSTQKASASSSVVSNSIALTIDDLDNIQIDITCISSLAQESILNALSALPLNYTTLTITVFDHALRNLYAQHKEFIGKHITYFIHVALSQEQSSRVFEWLNIFFQNDPVCLASQLGKIVCVTHADVQLEYVLDTQNHSICPSVNFTCGECEASSIMSTPADTQTSERFRHLANKFLSLFYDLVKQLQNDSRALQKLLTPTTCRALFHHCQVSEKAIQTLFTFYSRPHLQKELRACVSASKDSLSFYNHFTAGSFSQLLENTFSPAYLNSLSLSDRVVLYENILFTAYDYPCAPIVPFMLVINDCVHTDSDKLLQYTSVLFSLCLARKEMSLTQFFLKYVSNICEQSMGQILTLHLNEEQSFARIKRLLQLFAAGDAQTFHFLFGKSFDVILPYLVCRADDQSRQLLQHMLQYLNVDSFEPLLESYFSALLLYFVQKLDIEQIERCFGFLSNFGTFDKQRLFAKSNHICYQLLFDYDRHTRKVNYMLAYLDQAENKRSQPRDFNSDRKELTKYLDSKMGGYLVNLNIELLKKGNKLHLLKGLDMMIRSVSKCTLTLYAEKLMCVMRTAYECNGSQADDTLHQLLRVWETFIGHCNVKDIAPHLALICKDLMDFLPLNSAFTSQVFCKLIVHNEKQLGQYLKEVHFIPRNLRLMAEVYNVLDSHLVPLPDKGDTRAFVNCLRGLEHSLQVENPEIKYFHMQKLLRVMRENEQCLRFLCTPSKESSISPLVSRLTRLLLKDSSMPDERLRTLVGECLGELGALDPGRMDQTHFYRSEGRENDSADACLLSGSILEPDFPAALINRLVCTLDSIKDSVQQDCVNYAIQDLLHHYKVQNDDRHEVWKRIHARSQAVCQPLFNSRFVVTAQYESSAYPILREYPQYDKWITRWSISLVQTIKDKFTRAVLSACLSLIKYSAMMAQLLLPVIVLYALRDATCEERATMIIGEIKHVMTYWVSSSNERGPKATGNQREMENLHGSDQVHCYQAIFYLFDTLSSWYQRNLERLLLIKDSKKNLDSQVAADLQAGLEQVKRFQEEISKGELAQMAAACHSWARALLYMETHLAQSPKELQSRLEELQTVYVNLEEPDGVDGIIAIRKNKQTLVDRILVHEVSGELQEAISCCENALKLYPSQPQYIHTYLRCLLTLGHPNSALSIANSICSAQPQFSGDLHAYQVEACWKLGKWDSLEQALERQPNGGDALGRLLLANFRADERTFERSLQDARKKQMRTIAAAAIENGAYMRIYQNLIQLHMMSEVEQFHRLFRRTGQVKQQTLNMFVTRYTERLQTVQMSLRCQEPILNLLRTLVSAIELKDDLLQQAQEEHLSQLWLHSAKLARKGSNLQKAYNCLLEIDMLEQDAHSFSKLLRAKITLEKAKYHWALGGLEDKERAMKELQRGIETLAIHLGQDKSCLDAHVYAKIHLLLNNYSEQTANLDSSKLIVNYYQITKQFSNWEEPHYRLAMYYDRLGASFTKQEQKADAMVKVVRGFGESLKYGSKYVYESMPKLLTAWFELGVRAADASTEKSSNSSRRSNTSSLDSNWRKQCAEATACVERLLQTLPPYQFYTAFSQLISRICHKHEEVSAQICAIIGRLLITYPRQSMWIILGVLLNGKNKIRQEIANRIVKDACATKSLLAPLVEQYRKVGETLIEVSSYKGQGVKFDLLIQFPKIKRLLRASEEVLVPFQCFMNVQLPSSGFTGNASAGDLQSLGKENEGTLTHCAFTTNQATIANMESNVEVLRSAAKPKKVVIIGSDGNKYTMMCKPCDDLRKDCRAMEFNNLVNRLLRKDADARKRALSIKTYTVVPLSHDCGLVEWINNLSSYSAVLMQTYRLYSAIKKEMFAPSIATLRHVYPGKHVSVEQSVRTFVQDILPRAPPVFSHWFTHKFRDPTAWYMARLCFVRSCAVMNIVGYIIGLGDRHVENILIDQHTAQVVHVDFNMLFNKGEDLEVPETVPFRLTHNMVNAMGPSGYEGVFRNTCEETLRVMRHQREALMSVLKPFTYDPLLEWNAKSRRDNSMRKSSSAKINEEVLEVSNETANANISRISDRLTGVLRHGNKPMGLPISVKYQVAHLIEQATKLENLSRMYIGWASYL